MGKITEENSIQKIQKKVQKLKKWIYKDHFLKKEFNFNTYSEAVLFTNLLAYLAQKLNHHPDILLKYNFVSVCLSTHDAGDVTIKDIEFAQQVDKLMKV